ncbi:MAG: hypothetical protein M3133_01350 [Actinomycetota bacterium]|nr:hypothetical protein [Actinomycetota bacterium]
MERHEGRAFHQLVCAGTGAHFLFEVCGGSGLFLQRWLGLGGAAAFWAAVHAAWLTAARRGRAPTLLAAAAGSAFGTVVLHFDVWPWSLRRGLPLLEQAEGFDPSWVPAYNALLYAWSAASLAAIAVHTPRGSRRWALVGLLVTLPAKREALRHYAWLQEQARLRPAWWNRSGRRRPGLDIESEEWRSVNRTRGRP